ncbi:peroxiredoxin Q/BCP [Arthrobacter sp. V4I6]|uniref:thioredoxin-dependent thiol peroxidase n=1 Tax=unclassified Arthrobacter TaxID=235627 RepID=UPI00277F76C7|nr:MULTISPECIES: thioredoxin-dependent thiol peroxidase [unclassified Arthrobacter]MDQ0821333.1 peroxiredoxin Q/BCP [Arthrobacter sp. V1I7]MDQ0855597.1 peroxiredoxin Q/BCP [Arthrobacter sp. V4I6]
MTPTPTSPARPLKLQPGTAAPEFTLPDADGRLVSLADYRGSNVIVYFYPKAATPGCTTEACDFRDNLASLKGSGYTVLGISPDTPQALSDFSGDFALGYPLLSDADHSVAAAYGAWGEKVVDGQIAEGVVRSTVVLDAEGRVTWVRYHVAADGHVAALRKELGLQVSSRAPLGVR